ncbi:hypothetical protein D3C80_227870 [compost metagenome]
MQLEHRMDFALADRLIALPANTLQLIDKFLAFGVRAFIGPILLMHTGENAGSEHCRRKTRAFFIGPVDHDDRALCLDIGVIQCAHDFKSAKHTEYAVIFAACRLRVEMAAHIDRISIRIFAGAKEEHIAHRVDGHRQSGFFTPRLEKLAAFAVFIGQRLAVVATTNTRANFGHIHQAVPQAIAIDLEIAETGIVAEHHTLCLHISSMHQRWHCCQRFACYVVPATRLFGLNLLAVFAKT